MNSCNLPPGMRGIGADKGEEPQTCFPARRGVGRGSGESTGGSQGQGGPGTGWGRGPRGLCWAKGHGQVMGDFGAGAVLISQGEGGFIGCLRRC